MTPVVLASKSASRQAILAAAGVTFVLLAALNREARRRGLFGGRREPDPRQWLDLVALASICDVTRLVGFNRALTIKGLQMMSHWRNPGLSALMNVAGIAKAAAVWIPSGPRYGVFLTVAGVNGAALPPGNPTLQNLILELRNCGNPLIPVAAASFLETLFGLTAQIKYDPSYSQPAVTTQVQSALAVQFGFANRGFGQGVTADAVAATIQAVPGVIAVNVTALTAGAITSAGGDLASEGASFSLLRYNQWVKAAVPMPSRPAAPPGTIIPDTPSASAATPAELLVINPDPGQIIPGGMS